ncbi:cysteine hydrolase [Mycobacteroides chelonae]|uniref:cysteine hydrolase family protein n=1 Tax=Mycobacteroides chelonae TaxID=1774 RepID=UPI0008A87869|nr:cysteine hydrolase family protein [Mycobacteroides chelonae]OHU55711.1 cysteine hydrolase [Mycobacteroides chelonae]PKQ58180.1 cysteine hydrolase [Mycobacterium sp. MHSD3]
MTSMTLRAVSGHADLPAVLAESTVILIDYQNTYTTGVMELSGWSDAMDHAADLLSAARCTGATVVHVRHDSGVGSPYDIEQPIGQIHERMRPIAGEEVITKSAPNAFVETNLADVLKDAGNKQLVIAGFMTHMCVTFTAEGAFLRGYSPSVVARACATRSLPSIAGDVSAAQLHASALSTIGDLYATVVSSVSDLG